MGGYLAGRCMCAATPGCGQAIFEGHPGLQEGATAAKGEGVVGQGTEHPDLEEGEGHHRHTQQAMVEAGLLVVYARVRLAHKWDGQRTGNHGP